MSRCAYFNEDGWCGVNRLNLVYLEKATNWNLEGALHMDFPFYDAPNTATIICCHIIDDGKPILYVSHDEDDGMWQFLCGSTHDTDEARLVSLKEAFDLDNSVGVLKDMPCGYYAERKTQNDNWLVKKRSILSCRADNWNFSEK